MGFWSRMFGSARRGGRARADAGSVVQAEGVQAGVQAGVQEASAERILDFQVPSLNRSTELAAIPGELLLRFHTHGLDDAPGACLTVVTDGLSAHDQREIALTIRVFAAGDLRAHMREMTRLFTQIHYLARERRLVETGGFTQFRGRGPFGRSDSGLVYVDARPIPGVDLPLDALAAILVDSAEIRVVVACGPYRILTRIGRQCGVYPFPFWNDLARPSVATVGRESESLLAKVARARIPGVAFVAENDRLRVVIAPRARTALAKVTSGLTGTDALALLTDPAPEADARLVWCPGQTRPEAITPPGTDGSRVTGSFLALVPASQKDEVRLLEDGYAALLSDKSWASLRNAFRNQRRFVLHAPGSPVLVVDWLREAYVNPVDGQTYLSAHGWHDYEPPASSSRVRARERVVLLSADHDALAAIAPRVLGDYMSAISAQLAAIPESTELARHTLYVQCVLEPTVPPNIITKCLPAGAFPDHVVTRIVRIEAPRVRSKIAFQLVVERGSDA
jgi:Domain of unknown function (DUF3480)